MLHCHLKNGHSDISFLYLPDLGFSCFTRLHVRCSYSTGSFLPLSVQVFTLPPLPAVSQPGPLSLELRVASGMRGLQGLLKALGTGLWSQLHNEGVLMGEHSTAASLPWWEFHGYKGCFHFASFCLFLL